MDLLLRPLANLNGVITEHLDPRLADWPLMSSPFLTIAVSLLYVYVVKIVLDASCQLADINKLEDHMKSLVDKFYRHFILGSTLTRDITTRLGPALMENREPFQIKKTLFVYNLFQVIFSSWLFYRFAIGGWLTGEYNFICQPLDTSTSPKAMMMVSSMYWYYISKFTEFFDTIFFIMRKKYNQVTTLHVVHHGIMPLGVWIAAAYSPGGQVSFVPLLNTFVHIIMYSYYLLSAFGPKVQKYLWWKKYLTSLQIIQFVVIMIQSTQPLIINCPYPKAISYWITCEAALFLFLFKQFYDEAYKKKSRITTTEKGVTEKNGSRESKKVAKKLH